MRLPDDVRAGDGFAGAWFFVERRVPSQPPQDMKEYPMIPLQFERRAPALMLERAEQFAGEMERRRSVRHFSPEPVDAAVIEQVVRAAHSAPSGANKQPWTFVAVADPALKRAIREAAEQEESRNYNGRMTPEWLEDLAPLGTTWRKEFLEIAPWLVVVFARGYAVHNGTRRKHYYVQESVGIACGMLLAAAHHAGLATLTHTPSPMNFLAKILGRPENERPYLLIPMGYPAADATVPDISKQPLEAALAWC